MNVSKQATPFFSAAAARHFSRDQTLENRRMLRHGASELFSRNDVVNQQHAHLIARQGDILAGLVAQDDTGAVRVRVGADNQIHIVVLGHLDRDVETFFVLRVRGLGRSGNPRRSPSAQERR